MQFISHYFPSLSKRQTEQFAALPALYEEWNVRINVVSRRDMANLELHHILHSLAIAKFVSFKDGTKLMDLGTGGGFPGIPLAVLFPDCRFHLVDSIGKKLRVVDEVASAIGLRNVKTFHSRAEQMPYEYDFVLSRAVAPVSDLLKWTKGKYSRHSFNAIRNGLICLKGMHIESEIPKGAKHQCTPVGSFFSEPFFEEKAIWYFPV